MKRRLLILTAIFISILILCSCGSSSADPPADDPPESAVQEPEPAEEPEPLLETEEPEPAEELSEEPDEPEPVEEGPAEPFLGDEGLAELIRGTCSKKLLSGEKNKAISVAVCYTATDEISYYNADQWMYSASLFKLPFMMKIANDELNGVYTGGEFFGGCEEVLKAVLTHSDNTASYGLIKGKHYSWEDLRNNEIALSGWDVSEFPEGYADVHEWQDYSARLVMQFLRELYYDQEEYPSVIKYMCEASPGSYLKNGAHGYKIKVAQKYGSYERPCVDHIAGIIFTDEPILVVVMTANVGVNSANRIMGSIAEKLIARANEYTAGSTAPAE